MCRDEERELHEALEQLDAEATLDDGRAVVPPRGGPGQRARAGCRDWWSGPAGSPACCASGAGPWWPRSTPLPTSTWSPRSRPRRPAWPASWQRPRPRRRRAGRPSVPRSTAALGVLDAEEADLRERWSTRAGGDDAPDQAIARVRCPARNSWPAPPAGSSRTSTHWDPGSAALEQRVSRRGGAGRPAGPEVGRARRGDRGAGGRAARPHRRARGGRARRRDRHRPRRTRPRRAATARPPGPRRSSVRCPTSRARAGASCCAKSTASWVRWSTSSRSTRDGTPPSRRRPVPVSPPSSSTAGARHRRLWPPCASVASPERCWRRGSRLVLAAARRGGAAAGQQRRAGARATSGRARAARWPNRSSTPWSAAPCASTAGRRRSTSPSPATTWLSSPPRATASPPPAGGCARGRAW